MPNNTATSWIPGARDYLGSGVNIFGNYFKPVLKDRFLDFTPSDLPPAQWNDQMLPGTTAPYKLPASVAYTNKSSAHGETIIADSKMKMSEELSTRANVTGTYGAFSATVKASYKKVDDTEEDSWYCCTDGSQKVYALQARNLGPELIHKQVKTKDIYTDLLAVLNASQPCNAQTEEKYFAFFDWYGTHVITEVEMGGGLHIFTSVKKSYFQTEQEVKTSATAEYTGVFEAGAGADWKRKNEKWLSHRSGEIDAYGGDSGSPLLAKVMSGILPTTDLSADLAQWAASVPANPVMVDFKLTKIGDLFGTNSQRMMVNDAYERYAQSYLSLSFAGPENLLEWRKQPVGNLPLSQSHGLPGGGIKLNHRFQGWCVINRTTGAVEATIPFALKTAEQVVPAELKDANRYNNDNYIVLFSHWEASYIVTNSNWGETPFNSEMTAFLRRCGGGKVLQDYNDSHTNRASNADPYFNGFYVLCGVVGSGAGRGQEFSNIYWKTGSPQRREFIIPLVPQRSGRGFRLNLLDLG